MRPDDVIGACPTCSMTLVACRRGDFARPCWNTPEGAALDEAEIKAKVEAAVERSRAAPPPPDDFDARARERVEYERGRQDERERCAGMVSRAADLARAANRKKAAAELDMLARDIADFREVVNSAAHGRGED